MEELAHIAHGKRKFRCPKCGRHRMQEAKQKKVRKAKRAAGSLRDFDF